uniref:Unkown protein n=1 Tax=Riptortus pedestris TaxID=329032 RepID=R4WQT6_RIPPE|nr:unkown protein [Riptortus pedestris]
MNSKMTYLMMKKNPLVLIATHSGTVHNHRVIKVEEPDESLVTLNDIEEAYALSLCNKIDKAEAKKRFLPHKTLKSSTENSKPNKIRDLSAATPPAPVFGDIKLITLEESIKLQYEQTKHLKEVQLSHATERLKNSRFRMGETLPGPDNLTQYRDNHSYHHSEDESGEECDNGEE